VSELERLEPIKRGKTLELYLDFKVGDEPEVFDPSELESEIRDKAGRLVGRFTVTDDVAAPGRYYLTVQTDASWPLGDLFADVKRTSGSLVDYTETFIIPVERAQTL
jgi:hypothetical protein